MKTYHDHNGIIVPFNSSNIDTDTIFPKQFLYTTSKKNLGQYLFNNLRYLHNTKKTKNPKFILNNSIYKNSTILLTRHNFGCGSSREHAVWSLIDYGFYAIIANSFSDIFYINSLNNHLLPIILTNSQINNLFDIVNQNIGVKLTINTKKKYLSILNFNLTFNNKKNQELLNYIKNHEFNQIKLTLSNKHKIQNYENNQPDYLK